MFACEVSRAAEGSGEADAADGAGVLAPDQAVWILMPREMVPDPWRGRIRDLALLAMLPDEAQALFRGEAGAPIVQPADEVLLKLVVEGHTVPQIARRTNCSVRTVQRRLATLRARYGATSTAQLAALVSASRL